MENFILLSILLTIILSVVLFFDITFKGVRHMQPPGPTPWPIIGNIPLLGNKPHKSLSDLSKIYGPIMRLKLGSITTVVISSPEIAKEMYVKHDMVFSDRFVPDAGRIRDHHKFSIGYLPICPKWREIKKIITIHLFTNNQLDVSENIWQKKVDELIVYVDHCSKNGLMVNIGTAAFTTLLNMLSNTILSIDLCKYDSPHTQEFKDAFWHILEELGKPNISDFFPLVRLLDLQGAKRRIGHYFDKMMETFDKIIYARLRDNNKIKDVLGTLLYFVEENVLSLDDVRHLLLDLFIAGTDTTSNTIEWGMAELLCHLEIMKKAQDEVDRILGGDNPLTQEENISKIPYIEAIIKETLRMHPATPFLVPHIAKEDVILYNYNVPRSSIVWVNVWSIGRDPSVWPNPDLFAPERFLSNEIDMKGHHFELIPFGAGRRICPGMSLATRIVTLILATLIHSFNWKFEDGMNLENIILDDKFGLTLHKVHPLLVSPLSR